MLHWTEYRLMEMKEKGVSLFDTYVFSVSDRLKHMIIKIRRYHEIL